MIRRPLWTVPISSTLVAKLKDAGYEYIEDVLCDTNNEDVKQLISDDAVNFESLISNPLSSSAADLFKMELKKSEGIVTFSKAIDDLFDCGIPTSKITEIVGAPATGKTQLCLQLCVSVQIPDFIGGLSGSAIYVSTNNNFSFKRIREIHDSCASHCAKIVGDINSLSNSKKQMILDFIQKDPLCCTIRINIETVEQLRACMFNIEKMLETKKNVRLLIIDSFTFPFYSIEANIERTRKISTLLNHLNKMAVSHQLAIILINELTTCLLNNKSKEVIPSLGETFAHAVHNRLILGEKNNEGSYTALLAKSSGSPTGTAFFQITDGGIRDVPIK